MSHYEPPHLDLHCLQIQLFSQSFKKFNRSKSFQVSIHPSSVNFQVGYFESPYLVYHEKVKTTKVRS